MMVSASGDEGLEGRVSEHGVSSSLLVADSALGDGGSDPDGSESAVVGFSLAVPERKGLQGSLPVM